MTNDYLAQSIDICTGGSVTITWTATDLCSTDDITATYTVTPPADVAITGPADETVLTCDFDNATHDQVQAQADLDQAIADWVAAQTASVTGGCNATVTNDYLAQSIDICTGGSVTITWTATDLCLPTILRLLTPLLRQRMLPLPDLQMKQY